MNKPIIGVIAAALALCASAAPALAKTRAYTSPPPKPCKIVETPEGFVIREHNTAAFIGDTAPASIPIGASVRLDAALVRGDNGESADARP